MSPEEYQAFKERHELCDREMELLNVETSPWLAEIEEKQKQKAEGE